MGVNPSAELLRVYLLLSAMRPTGFGPCRIPLTEILASREITWIDTTANRWVEWVSALDSEYMKDQARRAKIKAAAEEAKKRKR